MTKRGDLKFFIAVYLLMITSMYLLVIRVDKVYKNHYNSFYHSTVMNE